MIEIGTTICRFTGNEDDSVVCYIKSNGNTINFDVDKLEFEAYTTYFLELAYDLMRKEGNYNAMNTIAMAMDALEERNK